MQLELGEKLRIIRTRKGLQQQAVAEALGVSAAAVYKWERTGKMASKNLIALAKLYGISLDDLLTERVEPIPEPEPVVESAPAIDQTDSRKILIFDTVELLPRLSDQDIENVNNLVRSLASKGHDDPVASEQAG